MSLLPVARIEENRKKSQYHIYDNVLLKSVLRIVILFESLQQVNASACALGANRHGIVLVLW